MPASSYSAADLPRRDPAVREQLLGEQVVLFHQEWGQCCVLNQTAHFIWRQCDGASTVGEIRQRVAGRFTGTDARGQRRQVEETLEALQGGGFLLSPECGSVCRDQPPQASPTSGGLGGADPLELPPLSQHPQQVTLHVTPRCNLRCRHCFKSPASEEPRLAPLPSSRTQGDGDLPSLPVIQSWVDQAVGVGAERLVLTGGEVLTRPDWREIARYAGERLPTEVLTNGAQIDGEAADVLAAAGVTVQISVDGASAEVHEALRGPGTFAPTMAGVHHLLARGMGQRLAWSVCVNRLNLGSVESLLRLALDLGVGFVYLLWVTPRGSAGQRWEDLAISEGEAAELAGRLAPWLREYPGRIRVAGCEHVAAPAGRRGSGPRRAGGERLASSCAGEGRGRELPCPLAAGETLLVDVDGSIYPCGMLAAHEYRLGSMPVEGLAGALQSPRYQSLREMVALRAETLEACGGCDWRSLCRGACPGLAWVQHGDWWSTDTLCGARHVLYSQAVLSLVEPVGPCIT